jgi:hypothetical protein
LHISEICSSRWRRVQRLYEQGLINEDEASTKRRGILDEL